MEMSGARGWRDGEATRGAATEELLGAGALRIARVVEREARNLLARSLWTASALALRVPVFVATGQVARGD